MRAVLVCRKTQDFRTKDEPLRHFGAAPAGMGARTGEKGRAAKHFRAAIPFAESFLRIFVAKKPIITFSQS